MAAALVVLCGEVDQLAARLSTAGLVVSPPLSPAELATAIRVRSDPTREHAAAPRSLAAIAGRGVAEWGPMAVECDWFHARAQNPKTSMLACFSALAAIRELGRSTRYGT